MPPRAVRPPEPRNPSPLSPRLQSRLQQALDELDEWQDLLIERTALSPLESVTLLETLHLCRRAVARHTLPHWLRLIPRDRPPGIADFCAVVDDAIARLTQVQAASGPGAPADGPPA
jgi:hypothetical protein